MEGKKTTARRSRRTETTPAAPVAPKTAPARQRAAVNMPPVRDEAVATPSPSERQRKIELAAYFRAERRGFAPGDDWADWLAAEAEFDLQLQGPAAAKPPVPRPKKKTPGT